MSTFDGMEDLLDVKIDSRITTELATRIREDAKKAGQSFSGRIRWILERWHKEKDEITDLEARIKEADERLPKRD